MLTLEMRVALFYLGNRKYKSLFVTFALDVNEELIFREVAALTHPYRSIPYILLTFQASRYQRALHIDVGSLRSHDSDWHQISHSDHDDRLRNCPHGWSPPQAFPAVTGHYI